jgi:PST family polysaccharide transporter
LSQFSTSEQPPQIHQRPHHAELARVVTRSTVWVTLGSYLNQIIGFAATLILTRLLPPDLFGYFSLGLFWAGMLNVRTKVGLNYAAVREERTDGQLLGTYFALDTTAGLISMALGVGAAALFSSGLYGRDVIIMMLVLMLADNIAVLVGPWGIALEREMQLSRLALASLIAYTIAYIVALALAFMGAGIWSLLAVNLISYTLSAIGVYWLCRQRLPTIARLPWSFNAALARRILHTGVVTGLSMTMMSFVGQYDNWLIGTFVGAATLGYYDRAFRIANWATMLLNVVIGRVGYLTMARVKDDMIHLTHTVRLSFWVLLNLGIPMALTVAFAAPDIVLLLYTDKYLESIPFLRFLAIANFLWVFVNLVFWLTVALGQRRINVLMTASQGGVLMVVATPLTLLLGVQGTMIGVGTAMIFGALVSCWYIFRHVRLKVDEVFGAPAAGAAVAFALLLGLIQLPGWSDWSIIVRLLAVASSAAGAYWGMILALRPQETKVRIQYLIDLWRRRGD